jgi:hypothetical protein
MLNFPSLSLQQLLFLFVVSIPVNVILHEFGHAIPAAFLTKKEVHVFIGSYGDKTRCFKISFGSFVVWIKQNPLTWIKGLCKPTERNIPLSKQMIYIASGPAVPFVVAIVGCFLIFALNIHGRLNSFFTTFFYFSLATFLTSIIPIDRQIIANDGTIFYNDGYVLRRVYRLKKYNEKYNDAIKFYGEKEYRKAGELFNFLLSKKIYYEDIYRSAIAAFIMAKDYERASIIFTYFKNSFKLNSDDYCNSGLLNLRKKLYEQAKSDFEKSLSLSPDNIYCLNNIGYYYTLDRKYDKAIPYLDRAIALNPSFAYAYNNRGLAKIKTGNIAEGLGDINKSMELDSTNSYVYRNFGIYHMDIGEYEKALAFFKTARELDADTDMLPELKREAENCLIKQKTK